MTVVACSAIWQLLVGFVGPPQCLCKQRKIEVGVNGCNGVSSPHLTGMLLCFNAAITLACMCVLSWTLQKD